MVGIFKEFIETMNERFPKDRCTHDEGKATNKSLTSSWRNHARNRLYNKSRLRHNQPKTQENIMGFGHATKDRGSIRTSKTN